DAVAALKKFGAKIRQNEQGEVVLVVLHNTKITDASLVHLKGLVGLETLYCIMTYRRRRPTARSRGSGHLEARPRDKRSRAASEGRQR
ncbi:MAG: hypothetical protein P8L78_18535, partial [Mariniblastus sp.]|nr:hypothetical protein [Mariniblastus sp.]